jgi:hypothetical protein
MAFRLLGWSWFHQSENISLEMKLRFAGLPSRLSVLFRLDWIRDDEVKHDHRWLRFYPTIPPGFDCER